MLYRSGDIESYLRDGSKIIRRGGSCETLVNTAYNFVKYFSGTYEFEMVLGDVAVGGVGRHGHNGPVPVVKAGHIKN